LGIVKAVAFEYEPEEAVKPLLESFRTMVNHAIWVGTRGGIRGRFKLIRAVYEDFKHYGLHTHYTQNACEVASAILKNHKPNHRAPVAKRRFLKLDNQTYQLTNGTLRMPIKPRQFLTLKLKVGSYQRELLEDPALKLDSITLTEGKVIVTFEKTESKAPNHASVVTYDTNELSLDGVLSNGLETKPVHVDLREIARVPASRFERRRSLQSRLAHCQRKLRAKLGSDRERERRRVDTLLHRVAKEQVNLANQSSAKIVLEDLKDTRRSINRREKPEPAQWQTSTNIGSLEGFEAPPGQLALPTPAQLHRV
jgi:transposase